MQIQRGASLAQHSTMRLGGQAAYAAEIHNEDDITEAVALSDRQNIPIIMIGDGSNIVWKDDGFEGLLLINKIPGREIISENGKVKTIKLGAGENWDSAVAWAADQGLSGIECLSLIPGTVGATPIQNVGAYGQEISETLVELQAYDLIDRQYKVIPNEDCNFAYRSSKFKTTQRRRYLITSITLQLKKSNPAPPFYKSLQAYIDENQVTEFTPQTIRQAVIAIRNAKLPDPKVVANNGSFFANPIVCGEHFDSLLKQYPDMPHWHVKDDKHKVAAAWLIETAGFKNFSDPQTGMSTWPKQSLVFVNESAKSTADLIQFRDRIAAEVYRLFKITLQQEPELLP